MNLNSSGQKSYGKKFLSIMRDKPLKPAALKSYSWLSTKRRLYALSYHSCNIFTSSTKQDVEAYAKRHGYVVMREESRIIMA